MLLVGWLMAAVGFAQDQTPTDKATDLQLTNGELSSLPDAEKPTIASNPTGSITYKVWYDLNADHVQNEQEFGIPGVTVRLFDINHRQMGIAVTDYSGQYYFDDLPIGTSYYIVVEDIPEGYRLNTPHSLKYDLDKQQYHKNANFGFVPSKDGSICDRVVMTDIDGSTGITGITVNLYNADKEIIGVAVTDQGGYFLFNHLEAGKYFIAIDETTISNQFELFSDQEIMHEMAAGELFADATFHLRRKGVVLSDDFYDPEQCCELTLVNDGLTLNMRGISMNGRMLNYDNWEEGFNLAVLGNDRIYCEADDFTVEIKENADYGHAVFDRRNNLMWYKPNPGYSGRDVVTYEVCNNCELCKTASVVIDIEQYRPACMPSVYRECANPERSLIVCPEFCLNEAYHITDIEAYYGKDVVEVDNCIRYTAREGFMGSDVIKVTACTEEDCELAFINVSIGCKDPIAPKSIDDDLKSDGGKIHFNVLDNDSDPDSRLLFVKAQGETEHGTLEVLDNGAYTYTPNEGFEGLDTFTYEVCDESDLCAKGTVNIITELQPCREIDFANTSPAEKIEVCAEFCELSGEIMITNVNTDYNCKIELINDLCLTYTSLPMFVGDEVLGITACNELGDCQTIEVIVEVNVKQQEEVAYKVTEDEPFEQLMSNNLFEEEKEADVEANVEEIWESLDSNRSWDALLVNLVNGKVGEEIILEIYDLTNQLVYKEVIIQNETANRTVLDSLSLPTGIYTISLKTNERVIHSRFVKRR